jgi:hypothetical protein
MWWRGRSTPSRNSFNPIFPGFPDYSVPLLFPSADRVDRGTDPPLWRPRIRRDLTEYLRFVSPWHLPMAYRNPGCARAAGAIGSESPESGLMIPFPSPGSITDDAPGGGRVHQREVSSNEVAKKPTWSNPSSGGMRPRRFREKPTWSDEVAQKPTSGDAVANPRFHQKPSIFG